MPPHRTASQAPGWRSLRGKVAGATPKTTGDEGEGTGADWAAIRIREQLGEQSLSHCDSGEWSRDESVRE